MAGKNNQLQTVTSAVPTGTFAPTASSLAGWDTNSNLSANNLIEGYATTATAIGTTTLTVASAEQQYFTGTLAQIVVLPVVSTLALGQSFTIVNNSLGLVTVQSSGANVLQVMPSNYQLTATVISTSGTGTASWSWIYVAQAPSGGSAIVTLNADSGSATGAIVTISGSTTGLTTSASGSTLDLVDTNKVLAQTGELKYFSTSGGSSFTGWLPCDGSIVSQATYPDLFAQIGLLDPPNTIFDFQAPYTQGSLFSVAWDGSGVFVAVGVLEGTSWIQRSTDGVNWTVQNPATKVNSQFNQVTYGGGLFVGVKNSGTGETSTDGITWANTTTGAAAPLFDVIYGNSLYVTCQASGAKMITSTDAVTWTVRTSPKAACTSLAYGNSVYVGGSNNGTILTSTDAITWSTKSPELSAGTGGKTTIYAGSLYVAISASAGIFDTSTDGTNYIARSTNTTSSFISLAYNGSNLYFAGGNGGILYTSTDAITWSSQTSGTSSNINGVAFGASTYVYGGAGGVVRSSTDAVTWTSRTSNTTSVINTVIWSGSLFVYCTNGGGIGTSTDGITWTARTSGAAVNLISLAFGSSTYVYIATGGNIGTSTDAITWSTSTVGNVSAVSNITSLIYGSSLFVAAGLLGFLATSTNGSSWTMRASTTQTAINSVLYDGSNYLYYTGAGWTYTSTNAITWSYKPDTGAYNGSMSTSYANTTFFATGSNGFLATSTDCNLWTKQTLSFISPDYTLSSVAYGGGLYSCVAYPTVVSGSPAIFALSNNGTTWYQAQNNINSWNLNSLFFVNGRVRYTDRFMIPISAFNAPVYGNIVTSNATYSYTSTNNFALPKDSNLAITYNSPLAYSRGLYIKT